MNNKANTSSMGRRLMVILLLAVIIAGVWFMFLRSNEIGKEEISEMIVGEWLRSEGPYTIKIIEVQDEGKMKVEYYNPGLIHIGRSGWRLKEGELQLYVELQDENYPGSIYELTYDEEKDRLSGTYFQAVARQTYNVEFNKK